VKHPLQNHTSIRPESFDGGYNPMGPYTKPKPMRWAFGFVVACALCGVAGIVGAWVGQFLAWMF
jgi:hypothetical protein